MKVLREKGGCLGGLSCRLPGTLSEEEMRTHGETPPCVEKLTQRKERAGAQLESNTKTLSKPRRGLGGDQTCRHLDLPSGLENRGHIDVVVSAAPASMSRRGAPRTHYSLAKSTLFDYGP